MLRGHGHWHRRDSTPTAGLHDRLVRHRDVVHTHDVLVPNLVDDILFTQLDRSELDEAGEDVHLSHEVRELPALDPVQNRDHDRRHGHDGREHREHSDVEDCRIFEHVYLLKKSVGWVGERTVSG